MNDSSTLLNQRFEKHHKEVKEVLEDHRKGLNHDKAKSDMILEGKCQAFTIETQKKIGLQFAEKVKAM